MLSLQHTRAGGQVRPALLNVARTRVGEGATEAKALLRKMRLDAERRAADTALELPRVILVSRRPEQSLTPNNGKKNVPPDVYEIGGKVVMHSRDLSYYLGVENRRVVGAFEALCKVIGKDWQLCNGIPSAGYPSPKGTDRTWHLTAEAWRESLRLIEGRRGWSNAVDALFRRAHESGAIRWERNSMAEIAVDEVITAAKRREFRLANRSNCAEGDVARIRFGFSEWDGLEVEIKGEAVCSRDARGIVWWCCATRDVPAWDSIAGRWTKDWCLDIPDRLLVSETEKHEWEVLTSHGPRLLGHTAVGNHQSGWRTI
ncbi:hypothetical protein NUK34_08210 [Kerstersia gyiorum]|uniref:hypothetical protein n=1 Tax=Kerstersia gyiorum TaxID=206506 RepID=UPI00215001DF|nr:hypothetical protein [Kerstersia gyiorum]MCR4158834.1 hypothetical protein [Kerstersia gyiorum]